MDALFQDDFFLSNISSVVTVMRSAVKTGISQKTNQKATEKYR